MINEGDKIAVGISGGKDSLALLCALAAMRDFYPKKYSLVGLTVDMGFKEPMDLSPVEEFCQKLGVAYHIEKTAIASVIFENRKEKNPCSLCSKMRRGAINKAAVKLGCNKLALGHHCDDVIDTFMLNLFYGGKLGTFSPVTELEKSGITQIRPMIYVREKELTGFIKKAELPVVKSTCPADKNTRREDMKKLILQLEKDNRDIKSKIFGAISRGGLDGFGREFSDEKNN
jgi:tRNA(Ile)-lysidine synthase TilS/MesJ